MAVLQQNQLSPMFYSGWYGQCGNCEPFTLITGSGSSASYVHDSIQEIFCISDNAEGTTSFSGLLTVPALISIQPIKQLECGKSYRIIMKPGSDSLDIPNFVFGNEGTNDTHRIKEDCV